VFIIRSLGYFMLMSQFEQPCHFLLAYLEDYKMDPLSASPLITLSLFDDFAKDKNVTLVRCNILNQNIAENEARKVAELILENYQVEEDSNDVITFNKTPDQFDLDNFISRMKYRWKSQPPSVDL
jgi:ATP11 protein